MKLSDKATGWSFDCLTDAGGGPPPGGLVLQDVKHDGHSFAKDVRTVGLWIETELVDPSGTVVSRAKKLYPLDKTVFTVTGVDVLVPKPVGHPSGGTLAYLKEADAGLSFTDYFKDPKDNYVGYGVKAVFAAPTMMAGFTNCEYAGLTVEQLFLFSSYGNSPRHEPSGGLSAARFHPMIRYQFSPNPGHDPKKQYTRVSSIRIDYRLHLYLDRHYDVASNATLAQLGNQAGVFADSDSALGTVAVSVGSGVWHLFQKNTAATAVSAGSFDAVEKPIVLELTAPGLAKGFPKFRTTAGGKTVDVRCWDNVHWWGSRGPGAPLISAPGAFHCAHLHWRWGGAAKAGGVGGDPHFDPKTWPAGMTVPSGVKGMWGPLVDPGIWMQSLNVAIVKNDPKLDPAAGATGAALTKDDWKTLFDPGLRATPLDVYAGADIVLWYAAEVPSRVAVSPTGTGPASGATTYTAKSGGTVFLHGIFFAHDAEKTGLVVGSTNPAHRPTSEAAIRKAASWFRSAS